MSEPDLRVYVLHFESSAALDRAFDRVLESQHVFSTLLDADDLRLRFLAPASEADALVERLYLDGGLAWCSRHDTRQTQSAFELDNPPDGPGGGPPPPGDPY